MLHSARRRGQPTVFRQRLLQTGTYGPCRLPDGDRRQMPPGEQRHTVHYRQHADKNIQNFRRGELHDRRQQSLHRFRVEQRTVVERLRAAYTPHRHPAHRRQPHGDRDKPDIGHDKLERHRRNVMDSLLRQQRVRNGLHNHHTATGTTFRPAAINTVHLQRCQQPSWRRMHGREQTRAKILHHTRVGQHHPTDAIPRQRLRRDNTRAMPVHLRCRRPNAQLLRQRQFHAARLQRPVFLYRRNVDT